jgi:hypothetical protein
MKKEKNELKMSDDNKKSKRNTSGLIPYKKGHKGGPGRPKKLPKLDELLAEVLGETEEGKTQAQKILEAMRKKATLGDVKAAQLLLDRGYGKVKEQVDITTNDESLNNKIQIEIITATQK